MIEKYHSAEKEYGYNISLGGILNKKCSEATKEKLRIANLGKHMSDEAKRKIGAFNRGRHYSDEARKHMSEAQKKSFLNGNNAMHSPDARAKAAMKMRGKRLPAHVIQLASEAKFHAVKCLETGIIYPSIKNACEMVGANRSTIIRHCKNKVRNPKWEYV